MMKILLIRHGLKEYGGTSEDREMPLSNGGRSETRQLGDMLARLGFRPEIYLTSHYRHAREMGDLLATQLGNHPSARVLTVCALTPKSPTETFEDILDEAKNAGVDLSHQAVVALIGHEARLSQLLTRLTSARARPFNRAEAVYLAADSFADFLQGRGKVEFRLPVVDYQEDRLRQKVQSKITVSALLAGFTATALIELLLQEQKGDFSLAQMVAAVSLTAALAMFVAAVYMYDQLGMPEGFWVYGDRPQSRRVWFKEFEKNRRQHGPLYAHLMWTWSYVFTPAVLLGLAGFIAILSDTNELIVISGGLLVILAVLVYYWRTKPRLGTD